MIKLGSLSEAHKSSLLGRLGFDGPISVNAMTLKKLHAAFVTNVPFETLDIFLKKRFSLTLSDLYEKIVEQRRGGYCYELNGLFFYLMQALGFDVSIHNAKLFDSDESIIPDSQHMILIVKLDEPWLVDVGYGNGFLEPLSLANTQEQKRMNRLFRCIHRNFMYVIEERIDASWRPWYAFSQEPKQIGDFEERHHFHQASEQSVFFGKRICMIMRGDETIELQGNQLTRKNRSGTHTTMIEEEKISHLLQSEFGVCLFKPD